MRKFLIALTLAVLAGCGGGGDTVDADAGRAAAAAAGAPQITAQPADTTVTPGDSAVFRVTASNASRYQWYRNGRKIAGATQAAYTTGRASLGQHGDVLQVVAYASTGAKTSSRKAVLSVARTRSALANHAWGEGAALTGTPSIPAMTAAMDDSGRVVAVYFEISGDFLNPVYKVSASRATPRADGKAPRWSKPVELARPLLPAGLALTVAPGGKAYLSWQDLDACVDGTLGKPTQKCYYTYGTQFDPERDAWSKPARLSDNDTAHGFTHPVINDRGDVAILVNGWERASPGSLLRHIPAVLYRSAQGKTFKRQMLADLAGDGLTGSMIGSREFTVGLDGEGHLIVLGSVAQNATADIVMARGTVERGLGAQEIIDRRSSAARLDLNNNPTYSIDPAGRVAVSWWQNNGTANSRFVGITEAAPGAKVAVYDVGWWMTGINAGNAVVATASGDVLLYNLGACEFRRWTAARGMSPLQNLPENCMRFGFERSWIGYSRNGDYLTVSQASDDRNSWALYDAARNAFAETLGGPSPGRDYLFGSKDTALQFGGGSGGLLLSRGGIGAFVANLPYDTLPSAAEPAGDGRPSVLNLWALYLTK